MDSTQAAPRIAPLEPPYDPDMKRMLERWMPPGAAVEPLALFRTLAVHPELMSRMRPLGSGILGHGRITPRDREIVIHRTCARAGAQYEWGVHAVAFAQAVGLTQQQVNATVNGGPEDPAWSAQDTQLVRLADELHDSGTVSDPTWSALNARYTHELLLELLVIAGWYRTLAYVINAAGVPAEPWAASFPTA